MMTYLQPRKKNRYGWIVAVIAIILVLIVGLQFIFPQIIPGFFTSMARPFWRLEFSAESGAFKSNQSLLAENEELKRELEVADVARQSEKALEAENSELRQSFGRATSTPRILAAVLRRPPLTAYDELIIDVGEDFNMASGTIVYTTDRIRIGMITDVLGKTSKVRLYSSPGEKYEVLIGSGKEPATAVGRGGGQYEAKVPQESSIQEGDFVISPALDEAPFGVVTAKVSDQAEPFTKILFAPMVNVCNLRWVLVDKR